MTSHLAGCARQKVIQYQIMAGTARPTGSMFVTNRNLNNKFHSRVLVLKMRLGIYFLLFTLLVINSACAIHKPPELTGNQEATECVILLHGLARTNSSMNGMKEALVNAGYKTVNLDYPSRTKTIERIAAEEFVEAVNICEQAGAAQIHFVTHSLGGIILRQALTKKKPENLGRVVMLSPPNQGSAIATKLKNWGPYSWMNGPAGQALAAGTDSLPSRLGPVDYPVGVITGNRHALFDAWFASIIPGEDDGKVSVQEARVDGMADFLVLPKSHPFIMNADKVMAQTIHFLRYGRFSRL